MEPITDYRPPFYLGEKFIDGKNRTFEIIETHWGLPGKDDSKSIGGTIQLQNGHKINLHGSPDQSVLKKVGFKQLENPTAHVNTHPIETMQQLIQERKIVMI